MSARGGERGRRTAPVGAAGALAEEARSEAPTGAALSGCVVAVARRSDHAAFAALFSHFAPRLKTYFLRSGMAAAAAEELAQETMVLVWRKADLFDPARATASTWIFAIGRNLRVDALRRVRHAAPTVPFPGSPVPGSAEELGPSGHGAPPTAEGLVASAQREERLRQALRGLSPEQAEVLRLSYFDGRSHVQIGQALGIPLGTVKGRLRQALVRLRAALGGEGP